MGRLALVSLIAVLAFGCDSDDGGTDQGPPPVDDGPPVDHAAEFARLLTGFFDSADQSETDPEYFSVILDVCETSIPALGDHVLYVEQAITETRNSPYRQRIYVVEEVDGADADARSVVYELASPALEDSLIGACADPASISLTADDVQLRDGCAVTVSADASGYAGSTEGNGCSSAINGASYATSEVTVTEGRVDSWDRGYDAGNRQVWGAVSGPYEFLLKARP